MADNMTPYGSFRYPCCYFIFLPPSSVFTYLTLPKESSCSQMRDYLLEWVWVLCQSLHHWLFILPPSPFPMSPSPVLQREPCSAFVSRGFHFSPSFPPLESVCPFSWLLPHAHICKFKSGVWMWEKRYGICCSESDFFHLTWCSPSPSIFLTMWFHFSLWLNRRASVYDCHIFCIFICQWTSKLVIFLFKINFY